MSHVYLLGRVLCALWIRQLYGLSDDSKGPFVSLRRQHATLSGAVMTVGSFRARGMQKCFDITRLQAIKG